MELPQTHVPLCAAERPAGSENCISRRLCGVKIIECTYAHLGGLTPTHLDSML